MVATRFAVAVHIMMLLATAEQDEAADMVVATDGGGGACQAASATAAATALARTTSLRIAKSVNTNPVVVRRITGLLARAGLIRVRRGPGGAELAQPAARITLGDVWQAVNPGKARPLLPLHAQPDPACPVGRNVHAVLGEAFDDAERALLRSLASTTVAALVSGVTRYAA